MRFGVVYPQIEFPSDHAAIKEYAQTAEGLGYHHIIAYDHVLGANPERLGGWSGPYTFRNQFQEPFVFFAYLAGLTKSIEFTTSVIILPQRQTALVAKQAAELDVLSGGRLRLGVGLGWNAVEYQALSENFHTRGRRIEEQVRLLKLLWTQELVTFDGRWHKVSDAGINPLPIQRPIPIWFGGHSEQQLQRAAQLADGWMPNYRTPVDAAPSLQRLQGYLSAAGRTGLPFGLEARLPYGDGSPATWRQLIQGWQGLGVTHISINTMGFGFDRPHQHLAAIEKFAKVMDGV
jgi:probable F420-dependent oxidoreductase